MDPPPDRGPLTLRTGTVPAGTLHAGDARLSAPAVQLNRAPILQVLQEIVPRRGTVLEIGSGTGEHAVYMAANLRSEEHTSELQSLMRTSYAVFCLKKKKDN